jgi:hypothetical protein
MNLKQALADAQRLVEWANANGKPDHPITFPAALSKRITLDSDGRWMGHPAKFLTAPMTAGVTK